MRMRPIVPMRIRRVVQVRQSVESHMAAGTESSRRSTSSSALAESVLRDPLVCDLRDVCEIYSLYTLSTQPS